MHFRASSGPSGGRGLPGHSQSLTVPVGVGYLLSDAMEVPNQTSHGSAQEVATSHHSQALTMSTFEVFLKFRENQSRKNSLVSLAEFEGIPFFLIFHGAWCPRKRLLGSPMPSLPYKNPPVEHHDASIIRYTIDD